MEHLAYKKTSKECNRKGAIPLTEATLRCFDERGVPFYPSPRITLSATERNAPLQGYDSKIYRKSQRGRHKEKAALFLTSAGVQFSMEEQTNSFLSYKIAEEEEFVNTKKHRSSQAHYLRARCGACARRCFNYVALYQKLFLGAIISCKVR